MNKNLSSGANRNIWSDIFYSNNKFFTDDSTFQNGMASFTNAKE